MRIRSTTTNWIMEIDLPDSIHWNLRRIILNYVVDLNVVLFDPSKIDVDTLIWLDKSMPIHDDEYISGNFLLECVAYHDTTNEVVKWVNKRVKWTSSQFGDITQCVVFLGTKPVISRFALIMTDYDYRSFRFHVPTFIIHSYCVGVPIQTVMKMSTYFDCHAEGIHGLVSLIISNKDILSIQYIMAYLNIDYNTIYMHHKSHYKLWSFNVYEWLKDNSAKIKNQTCEQN